MDFSCSLPREGEFVAGLDPATNRMLVAAKVADVSGSCHLGCLVKLVYCWTEEGLFCQAASRSPKSLGWEVHPRFCIDNDPSGGQAVFMAKAAKSLGLSRERLLVLMRANAPTREQAVA